MSFKNPNIVREFPFFTHFACLPFIEKEQRQVIEKLQQKIEKEMSTKFNVEETLKRHDHMLSHVTLFMLTLKRQQTKDQIRQILQKEKEKITKLLSALKKVTLGEVKYFTRKNKSQKCEELTVIYAQIDEKSQNILNQLTDYLIRVLLTAEVIMENQLKTMRVQYDHKMGKFYPETFHVSLFRCRNLMEKEEFLEIYNKGIKGLLMGEEKEKSRQFKLNSFDIATMKEYSEVDGFYEPFQRFSLNAENENEEEKVLSKKGQIQMQGKQ